MAPTPGPFGPLAMIVTCYVDSQRAGCNLVGPRPEEPAARGEAIATFGISTALLTPFHADGALNLPLLKAHALWVLDNGASGVTLFGTTGEGASVGQDERRDAISALIAAGVPAEAITLGLAASAVSDAAAEVRQAVDVGVTQFLLLPPFYFKDVTEAGLQAWHAALFDMAVPEARFILYHIPQITQVPLSPALIGRLASAHPERVMAVKDSAGQWLNTQALLDAGDVPVLVGDERLLHKAAALGAAGSICGMANLHPARMRRLFESHVEDTDLSADVGVIVAQPVIPALKHAMVLQTGNDAWRHLRAPLRPLEGAAQDAIAARFAT